MSRKRIAWPLTAVVGGAILWWLVPGEAKPDDGMATAEQSYLVVRRPFVASIGFVGTITPGDGIGITAPFAGTVKSLNFSYGDRVLPGQLLLELDVAELEKSRNEAESAYLKATQTSADMSNWASGPEMSRARRSAATAIADLNDTERKVAETKALLDRGLVARSEYDGLLQQRRAQRMSTVSAQEELQSTLERGQGANRRITTLELANARARLNELNGQFSAAIVRACEPGIVVSPPTNKFAAADSGIHVGSSLTKGQLVGVIARAGGLAATFSLDEADVTRLKVGQPVIVTGAGFPGLSLPGRISNIAGEASASVTPGAKASFAAIARLDPITPEQTQQVRIGMSANIAVTTYNNPSALVVPPQAVRGAAPTASVLVRDKAGGSPRSVTVQVGQVGPDGVEILSGLKPGETIVWTMPTPPTQ